MPPAHLCQALEAVDADACREAATPIHPGHKSLEQLGLGPRVVFEELVGRLCVVRPVQASMINL